MLDEREWALVWAEMYLRPITSPAAKSPDRFVEHQRELKEGRQRALDLYETFTGFRETNHLALYHHRESIYGPPCGWCGKPLRTPRAKLCADCGTRVTCAAASE